MLRIGRTATWSNWAGTAMSTPAAVAHPASTDEAASVVLEAREHGLRVKAVGSGHSFTTVAVTDGVLVQLDRMCGVISADVPSGVVRVGAGTPLHQLNDALAALGLALPNLGDIDRQTISGALGTGTHGTGARFRGLADAVRGLRVVLADGSVHDCDAGHEVDLFEAARVSLGALGIITEVTLQCVPAFLLRAREEPGTLSATLEALDDLVDGTDHFEFYWFPHTDRVLTKRNTRLPVEAGERPLPAWRAWLDDDLLSNRVFEGVNRVSAARPRWVPRINRLTARVLSAREFTAASHRVFASQRDVRFREMEYAVPRPVAADLLRSLKRLTDGGDFALPFPVEVRFTAGDDVWLSTAHDRETAYIAVHQYHRMEHQGYFDAFEAMAREVDGRPHWGKLHGRSHADLRPAYARFDDFVAVRDRVDPDRLFANEYLTQVLGT